VVDFGTAFLYLVNNEISLHRGKPLIQPFVGYSNSMEGLSGGFVFGAGGSGLITPRLDLTPTQSGSNTPSRSGLSSTDFTQHSINAAFDKPSNDGGMKMDS
jgi:hypothetical protein